MPPVAVAEGTTRRQRTCRLSGQDGHQDVHQVPMWVEWSVEGLEMVQRDPRSAFATAGADVARDPEVGNPV